MDVDFHYHATYLAARFAGYSYERALRIAISAQMIDENNYEAVKTQNKHQIPVVATKGQVIHQFTPLATFFAGASENVKDRDKTASVWAVYHFLPGNFHLGTEYVRHALGGADNQYLASYYGDPVLDTEGIWKRRAWSGGKEPVEFDWLTRPRSPLAAFIVNNCREWVNQRDPNNVVVRENLSDYLAGVTAHVFVDTWAHQDFVGFASPTLNALARADMFFAFPSGSAYLRPDGADHDPTSWTQGFQQEGASRESTLGYEHSGTHSSFFPDKAYIGHAPVGHWPDHSALIWKYHPGWNGGKELIRNNPVQYREAFLNLVSALRCIRLNKPYRPIAITSANVYDVSTKLGVSRTDMQAILRVLWMDRSAKFQAKFQTQWRAGVIDAEWDDGILKHGERWRDLETQVGYERIPAWYPGSSPWIQNARDVVAAAEEQKLGGVPTLTFRALDYFKFNYAAKLHYRSVKNQLLLWNKRLIEGWNDGSALVDDYHAIGDQEEWRIKSRHVLVQSLADQTDQAKQDEIVVLLQYIEEAKDRQQLLDWFAGTANDLNPEHRGQVHRDTATFSNNSVASVEIQKVVEVLRSAKVGGTVVHNEESGGHGRSVSMEFAWLPSKEWFYSVTDTDGKLTSRPATLKAIDTALTEFHGTDSNPVKRATCAQTIVTRCQEFLANPTHAKEPRRIVVKSLGQSAAEVHARLDKLHNTRRNAVVGQLHV